MHCLHVGFFLLYVVLCCLKEASILTICSLTILMFFFFFFFLGGGGGVATDTLSGKPSSVKNGKILQLQILKSNLDTEYFVGETFVSEKR